MRAVRVAADRPAEEGDLALRRDAFAEAGSDAFDRVAGARRFDAFAVPEGRVIFFADLGLRFWVAIGNVLCCDSIMRCHWQKLRNVRSPEESRGEI
jgi:hypothetical protein